MATHRFEGILRQLRRAVQPLAEDESDARLLEHYLRQRDEAAFELLVQRHGPMVLGVCRRILVNEQDAEDAFQATFLVLVRKAASVKKQGSLGAWLYSVAYRTAREARRAMARRRAREARGVPRSAESAVGDTELREVLDRELAALPERYRAAVVLCDLEGKGRKETAVELGCPEGTVASRLARGRALLGRRLARCGLFMGGTAMLVRVASPASVSAALLSSTVRAAVSAAGPGAAVVSANVSSLVERVVRSMLMVKLRAMTALVLLVGVVGSGAGWVYYHRAEAAQAGKAEESEQEALRQELKRLQADLRRMNERATALEDRLKQMEEGPGEVLFRGKPAAHWVKLLKDRDPNYRREAIVALGGIGKVDRSIVPVLAGALKDDDDGVIMDAAQQLANIGKGGMPYLVEAVKDSRQGNRSAVFFAIGAAGPAAEVAIPVLVEILKGDSLADRKAAAEALTQIGPRAKAAVPALIGVLKKQKEDRWVAVSALRAIGRDAREAVPALLELLKESKPGTRGVVITALGEIGSKEAVPSLIDMVNSKEPNDYWNAFIALGKIGPDARAALPALMDLLRHSQGGDLPLKVAEAIEKIDPKAATEVKERQ